jgi:hypothetical protein
LLDRMSDVLERTVPGAGFTAGVLALITVGAPATATAAGLGAARALGSQSTLAKIASLFGGSILGVSTAAAAIWYGAHKNIERARDDEERSALRRFRQTNFGLLAATFVAWEVGQRFVRAPWGDVVPFVGYFVGLAAMFLLWLPKITARRRAAELREDPKAARRHQREKIFSIVGLILGAAGGGLGLYYGLKMAGRLP